MEDDLDPAYRAILELRTYTPDSNLDDSPALRQFQQETEQLKEVEQNINKTIESALGVVRDSLHNNKPVKPPAPKPHKNVSSRYAQPKRHVTSSHPTSFAHGTSLQGQYNQSQPPQQPPLHPQSYPQQYADYNQPQGQALYPQNYPLGPGQYPQNHPHVQALYPQGQPHYQHYSPSYPYFPESIPEDHSPSSTTIAPSPSEALRVRSELMAVPLPSVPPGLSEEELLAQARERALLLNTHDTNTGLFGHDPIYARESRVEFYHIRNHLKKQEEEQERLELRQKYEEGVRQRQAKEIQKLEKRKEYLRHQQLVQKQLQEEKQKRSETEAVQESVLGRLPPELLQTLMAMENALNRQSLSTSSTTTIDMPPMNAWQEFIRLKQQNSSNSKANKKKKVKAPGANKRSHRPPHRGRLVK